MKGTPTERYRAFNALLAQERRAGNYLHVFRDRRKSGAMSVKIWGFGGLPGQSQKELTELADRVTRRTTTQRGEKVTNTRFLFDVPRRPKQKPGMSARAARKIASFAKMYGDQTMVAELDQIRDEALSPTNMSYDTETVEVLDMDYTVIERRILSELKQTEERELKVEPLSFTRQLRIRE